MTRRIITTYVCALLLLVTPQASHAQFGKLKDKLKDKIGQKTKDAPKAEKTSEEKSDETTTKAESPDKAASLKPGEGAWANFDFVPGTRPIFVEDFTRDRVGNFPKRDRKSTRLNSRH